MISIEIGKDEVTAKNGETGKILRRPNTIRHERMLFGDFEAASAFFADLVRGVEGRWRLLRPVVTVRVVHDLPGGITPIELGALTEAVARSSRTFALPHISEVFEQDLRRYDGVILFIHWWPACIGH